MENAKVYFIDFRTKPNYNMLHKLDKLIRMAGMEKIDFKNKFTALKIHFGEPGNLSYIRPNYAKKVADIVKECGGLPFLTDANTLYMGQRSNAVQHLYAASENGFNPLSTGVNLIIADGLKGSDYKEIEVNGKHVKNAKIGNAIVESDVIISLNHFKGHELTGFGGALKNLGMGCGSRGGKLEMHSSSKPMIEKDACASCGLCIKNCAHSAIKFDKNKKADIDYSKCVGCGQCIAMCMYGAAIASLDEDSGVINEKIAEYAFAVLKGKPGFHINFLMDVSPNCDCWASNDLAIVPNIGIAASFDPVALDKACVDMVTEAPVLKGSVLDGKCPDHTDKFKEIYPRIDWMAGLKHAQSLGLGSVEYELVKVD